jgi:hypothetical protein
MLKQIFGAGLLSLAVGAASAQTSPQIALATQQEAAAAIAARDEYMSAVNAADVSIWLRRPGSSADTDALAQYLAANVIPWSDEERERLDAMTERVSPRLAALAPWLPGRVQIARIRIDASSGADFTRGDTIFLASLKPTDEAMDERFFHELFHVLSRHNPARRDELYAIVGFQRCTPLTLDIALRARILTNPDAPVVEYASQITVEGQTVWATPLMVADLSRYTARSDLFDHVELQFMPLRRDAQGQCTADPSSTLTQAQLGAAVIARAGGNTMYVLHPEELVADNFAQMMMGRDVPSPEVHAHLATLLNIERPSR